jgi:hypothetical protein
VNGSAASSNGSAANTIKAAAGLSIVDGRGRAVSASPSNDGVVTFEARAGERYTVRVTN